MELEALHQSGVGQTLQPPLGGGRRAPRVDPSMDLAAEDVPQGADQREHLEIAGIGVERARHAARRASHGLGAIELDKLSIPLGGCVG
jgi:hypothetical protein